MELKKIKNLTNREQSVVYRGKQIVLPASETLDMDKDLAAVFLDKCDGLVDEIIDIGGVFEVQKEDVIWVGNMTGNPDAPSMVKTKRTEKGHWFDAEVPNPNKEPRELRRTMKGGMKEVMGASGLEGLNLLPKTIRVPPYKRVKLPKNLGRWFLSRVSAGSTRDAITSRAPSEFEPDASWALDDMRRYLQLLDPAVDGHQLGRSEAQLKAKKTGSGAGAKAAYDKIVREAKSLILKRIYFRVINPKYRLPTQDEFEEYKLAQVGPGDGGSDPEDVTLPPRSASSEAAATL